METGRHKSRRRTGEKKKNKLQSNGIATPAKTHAEKEV